MDIVSNNVRLGIPGLLGMGPGAYAGAVCPDCDRDCWSFAGGLRLNRDFVARAGFHLSAVRSYLWANIS